jgi:predicted metal-dependent hydrolase
MSLEELNWEPFKVLLKRSPKRRTWLIQPGPDFTVKLSVPALMSEQKIFSLLNKHQLWIEKKLKGFKGKSPMKNTHRWVNDEELYFQGKRLKLSLLRSAYPHVSHDEEKIYISASLHQAHKLKKIFEDWLFEQSREQTLKLLTKWQPRFSLNKEIPLGFRLLKSSWGQCRSDGKITLHKFLYRTHPEFFEYVLVHEMCHLFHMNHGPAFKALLSEMIPHWREIKRKYEPMLY